MKVLYLLLACAAAQATAAPLPQRTREELAATKVAFTEERDAAAIFVNERPWFLRNMGRLCGKELGMPEAAYEEPESRWEKNNYRYSATVNRYQAKKRNEKKSTQAIAQGFLDGMDEIRRIDEKAALDAKAQLKAASDRVQACQMFFADSEAGKLNLNPGDQYHDVLETLARDLFDPVPSH